MPIELEGDANQEDEDDAAAPDAIPLEVEANPEDEDDEAAAPDAIPLHPSGCSVSEISMTS